MQRREEILEACGYPMDRTPIPGGLYVPAVKHNDVVYLSGAIPIDRKTVIAIGKVPSVVSVEEAYNAAALCAANLLRVYARDIGSLETIYRILKIVGFVNSDPDFTDPHLVINGASQLMIDVLGESGKHARSAVGMATLPRGASVEVEVVVATI